MYRDEVRKLSWPVILAALAAVILAGFLLIRPLAASDDSETTGAIIRSIRETALQCYVVEGVYPPSVSYLEENYGLVINHDDYYIHYEIFAENVPPDVRVSAKRR